MEYTEEDIQKLVENAKQGEEESFAKLFDIFSDRIYRFLRFRVSTDETAEDLTQTVFLELIQGLKRYRKQNAKFSTWLFQIARFRLIDYYRKEKSNISLSQIESYSALHPKVDPTYVEISGIDQALLKLPEKYQTVIELRFREDLKHTEIAKILKTTPLNVRVMQYRALKALRKILEEKEI